MYSEVSRSGWPMSGTWSRPDAAAAVAAVVEAAADTFAYADSSPGTDCL